MDLLVQRGQTAPGSWVPQPKTVPGSTTQPGGLTTGEHYSRSQRLDLVLEPLGHAANGRAPNRLTEQGLGDLAHLAHLTLPYGGLFAGLGYEARGMTGARSVRPPGHPGG